jgi:hypothetical protein
MAAMCGFYFMRRDGVNKHNLTYFLLIFTSVSVSSLDLSRVQSNESDFLPSVPNGPVTGRPSIPNSSITQNFLPKNKNENSGSVTQRPMKFSNELFPFIKKPPF